ncbi:MAG: hypothetical protein ABSB29_05200 [Nitrososphaerales archaeon]|jgi:hypothetical protein
MQAEGIPGISARVQDGSVSITPDKLADQAIERTGGTLAARARPSVVLALLEERLLRLENEATCDLPQPYKYHRLVDQDYYMTTVLDLNEYANSGLKVGDVVTVELRKSTERRLNFAQTAE